MQQASRMLVAAFFAANVSMALAAPSPEEAREQMAALDWKRGPTAASLGSKATITIPGGTGVLEEKDGARFLELTGNLPSPGHSILVSNSWWAAFTFDPVGYVKDDEKIDADALLAQLKEQDGPSNEERRRRGMAALYTDGWHVPPHYDSATRHLEWALRLRSADSSAPVINYTVRLLGRSGYESATLVSGPETLDEDVRSFKSILKDFSFKEGERYAEFKQGDRIAQFGLAALVAGGAAAVATKTGFWKVLAGFLAASWKLVVGAVVAVGVGVRKLFKRD
jgi:uncharacterized membrane-anchored protein